VTAAVLWVGRRPPAGFRGDVAHDAAAALIAVAAARQTVRTLLIGPSLTWRDRVTLARRIRDDLVVAPPVILAVGDPETPGEIEPDGFDAVLADDAALARVVAATPRVSTLSRSALLELLSMSPLDAERDAGTRWRRWSNRAIRTIGLVFVADACDVIDLERPAAGEAAAHAAHAAQSVRHGATIVVGGASYLAAPIGPGGRVLCLRNDRIAIRDAEARAALTAVAARLHREALVMTATTGEHEDLANRLVERRLGWLTRAAIEHHLVIETRRARRRRTPLSVAVVDVAGMQRINERWGHDAGDAVLRQIGEIAAHELRDFDITGHFQGAALAVILGGASVADAQRAMTRLLDAIQFAPLRVGDDEIPVTVQIGVVEVGDGDDPAAALRAAGRRAAHAGGVTVGGDEGSRAGPARPAPFRPGALLPGGVRVLHEIGQGALGVVYRAVDVSLSRPVAVKVLRAELANDPVMFEEFRAEAALLGNVRHPNLAQIYSFGVDAGRPYFVMELIEGETLEARIRRTAKAGEAPSVAAVLDMLDQIGSVLDTLHRAGIVHRDVKPSNIILDPFRNRAVLLDVGLARPIGAVGVIGGTRGYMPPEAVAGLAAMPSFDLFGLAVTAYQALTLRSPWRVRDPIDSAPPEAPTAAQADTGPSEAVRWDVEVGRWATERIDDELAAADPVLRRALSIEPERRYETAMDMVNALRWALDGLGRPAASDAIPAQSTAPCSRGIVLRGLRWALPRGDDLGAGGAAPSVPALAWVPLDEAAALLGRATRIDPSGALARRAATATVRASLRRFFPANADTLVTRRVLTELGGIWARYHTWGTVTVHVAAPGRASVRLDDVPFAIDGLTAWVEGFLAEVATLTGATRAEVARRPGTERMIRVELEWDEPVEPREPATGAGGSGV
jgi:diguanylate cyclase (GGDEF)-like protein